jgi:nucleoid-associated protein YejK
MNNQWIKQNQHKYAKQLKDNIANKDEINLDHLGFNAGETVYMTEEVVKDLEKAIKTDYHEYFAQDGFFWGQQFQETSMNEYRKQDEEFLEFCKWALKNKQVVEYECSW